MKFKIVYIEHSPSHLITRPEDIWKLDMSWKDDMQESLYVYGLNGRNKVIYSHCVAKGSQNSMQVLPCDLIRPLLHLGCKNAIIAHNHPSGSNEPSDEDIAFTKKIDSAMKLMGMALLDHIIVTPDSDSVYSFRQNAIVFETGEAL